MAKKSMQLMIESSIAIAFREYAKSKGVTHCVLGQKLFEKFLQNPEAFLTVGLEPIITPTPGEASGEANENGSHPVVIYVFSNYTNVQTPELVNLQG